MDYKELIEERKKSMSEIITLAKEEKRGLTDQEKETMATLSSEIDSYRSAFEAEAKIAELELEEKAEKRGADIAKRKFDTGTKNADNSDVAEIEERSKAFAEFILTGNEARAMNTLTGEDGGYLVPETWYNSIIEKKVPATVVRRYATVVNITNTMNIPCEGAGLVASWNVEGGTVVEKQAKFTNAILELRKMIFTIPVTTELLEDNAFNIESFLAGLSGRVMAQGEEQAFMNGTAAGNQPVGILQSGITPTATASSTAVTAEEIIAFFYDLPTQYMANATWFISAGFAAAVRKLTTGTGGVPLWQDSLALGQPPTLLGRPVEISSQLGNVAAGQNVATLGDVSYYYIGDKGSLSVKRLNEVYAVTDSVGFQFRQRTSGVLTNTDAIKVLKMKA